MPPPARTRLMLSCKWPCFLLGGDCLNLPFRLKPPTENFLLPRSRQDYLSWSRLNQDLEPDPNVASATEVDSHLSVPTAHLPKQSAPQDSSSAIPSSAIPSSIPKNMAPSPPLPGRRNSSTFVKELAPYLVYQNVSDQSSASMAALERGHLEGPSRAPSMGNTFMVDHNEGGDVNGNVDGIFSPRRRQSIHNLPPSVIIPKFKIEYEPRICQYVGRILTLALFIRLRV